MKTLVLYHQVPISGVTDAQWTAAVRKGGYGGRVVVGKDLMVV